MQELGPYRLLAELGRGPAGVVYRAHDPWLERDVAVRVLGGGPVGALDRVRDEARRLARLRHPSAPQVLAVGETAGVAWVAMDLVEGRALVGPERASLPPRDAARVVLELARALAQAHALGLVHGDLRAERVVIAADGSPVMCQLGAAQLLGWVSTRVSRDGQLLGPIGDLAPEQLSGPQARAASWTDVHALGNLLARLVGGRPLFGGPEQPQLVVVDQVLNRAPDLSQVAARARPLADLCARCLAKRPEERPDAASVAAALEAWLEQERGSRAAERASRPLQQLTWALAGGLLLALVPGFLWARTAQRADAGTAAIHSAASLAAPAPELAAPTSVEQAWQQAARAVERGELEAALSQLERGRSLGEDPRLIALGSAVQLELGRDPEALLRGLEPALARWPEDLWLRAEAQHLRARQGGSPLDELVRLSQATASSAPALARALACLRLAEATRLSDAGRARELVERGLQAVPGLVGLRLEVVRLREDAGDLNGAADALEEARAAGPRAPSALCAWSAFQRRHGDVREARKALEAALSLDPDQPELLAERALVGATLSDWEAVRESAQRLSQAPRGYAPASAVTGMCTALALEGLHSGAPTTARRIEADLTQALARQPDAPDLLWARAQARQAQGDLPGAAADLRAALRAYPPKHPEAERLGEELKRLERPR